MSEQRENRPEQQDLWIVAGELPAATPHATGRRVKALALLAIVSSLAGASAAEVTPDGRALLREALARPGGYSQMCFAPPPVVPGKMSFGGEDRWLAATFNSLSAERLDECRVRRAEVVPALVEALTGMDLRREAGEGGPRPALPTERDSGVTPERLSRLHLALCRELTAVEALPQLMRLEQELSDLVDAAERDTAAPLPALDANAPLRFVTPGAKGGDLQWFSAQTPLARRVTARFFQAEVLGTMLSVVCRSRFLPALQSRFAGERQRALLERRASAELRVQRETRESLQHLLAPDHNSPSSSESDLVLELNPGLPGQLAFTPPSSLRDARKHRDDLAAASDAEGTHAFTAENRAAVRAVVQACLSEGAVRVPAGESPLPARVERSPFASSPTADVKENGHIAIPVPAGTYRVGSDASRTNPAHEVTLKSFWISEAETTNEQFTAFVLATGHVTDAEKDGGMVFREGMDDWEWKKDATANWRHPFGKDGEGAEAMPRHPVTQISGADAEAYCRWVGGRLPTVDEWEVAARAGATTKYPWGDQFEARKANIWNGETHRRDTRLDGFLYTAPVKAFPPNAWGLFDVIGNVFEYGAGLPHHLPPDSAARMIAGRGGSWWCSAGTCSFYNLEEIGAMDRHGSLANQGFRVVFDEDEPTE